MKKVLMLIFVAATVVGCSTVEDVKPYERRWMHADTNQDSSSLLDDGYWACYTWSGIPMPCP